MRILVVIGHPRPGSFCHELAESARDEFCRAGHSVVCHDLYAEKFDAILPQSETPKGATVTAEVDRHCRELLAADVYLVVHPVWWSMPPAIIKGWVDRVFRPGVAFEFGPQGSAGKLGGKRALVLTTSNSPADDEMARYGDPLENLWKNCIFGFCGVTDFHRRHFAAMTRSGPKQRQTWCEEVRQLVRERYLDSVLHCG